MSKSKIFLNSKVCLNGLLVGFEPVMTKTKCVLTTETTELGLKKLSKLL